jgi:phosphate-selective porin OprO/OprP
VRNFSEILSAELAAMRGPMSMQFEYLRTFTGKQQALEPPEFDSWYIQAGWVVTGEKRSYSRTTRTFDGVKPNSRLGLNGGTGAWEVGVRYSELSPVGQKQFGNKETNLTLGINWYPTDYMRVMANYIWVRSDLDFSRNSSPQNEYANIFAMRLQIQF